MQKLAFVEKKGFYTSHTLPVNGFFLLLKWDDDKEKTGFIQINSPY